MTTAPRLLCISNGHGEDAIALRILAALRSQLPDLNLAALPIVGEGRTFPKHGIPLIAATKTLPSGGFIYMDSRQLARDVSSGLVQQTLAQLRALKQWSRDGGSILAIGDLIPMAFAWWSGLPYSVVGTAKSAYYWRDEQGPLPDLPWYTGWAGSIYLPWERWFMQHDRCRGVVVRDALTAQELRQQGISQVYTGNPMMDDLEPTGAHPLKPPVESALTILLLPGSRTPEAVANWQLILQAVDGVQQHFHPRWVHCLGAIAPTLELAPFQSSLAAAGWQAVPEAAAQFQKQTASIYLTQTAYPDCLHLADAAIALAGTATEQFVGQGKPAFTIPGSGPQFTATFARLQTRLLGPSVILVNTPQDIGAAMAHTLNDPERLQAIRENGRRRLGSPGAAAAIAAMLATQWLATDR